MKAAWDLGFGGFFGICKRIYEYDDERRETARDTCGTYNFVFVQTVSFQPCPPN